jgi:hypothetical protein
MEQDDIAVMDRGFCSYVHVCLLFTRRVYAVFRLHQSQKLDFREARNLVKPRKNVVCGKRLKKLGKMDQLLLWHKPTTEPSWMSKEQFLNIQEMIIVRILRYKLDRRGFRTTEITIVTTLLDAERYSRAAIADLYDIRWGIETNFKHLKITMGMDVLRSKTVDGVLEELYAFFLVYNLVRLIMLESAKRQAVPVKQISFIDALRWLQTAGVGKPISKLILNPCRPGRLEPRVRKRRPKGYRLMTRPRQSSSEITPQQQFIAA